MQLTITLPEKLIEELRAYKAQSGVPVSTLLARLADTFLDGERK